MPKQPISTCRWTAVLLAAWAGLMPPAAGAQPSGSVACPATSGGHRAASAGVGTLFHGDPARRESLAPDSTRSGPGGSFVNTWALPAGSGVVLVCHYAGAPDLVLPLGPGPRRCEQTRSAFVCR